MSMAQPIDHVAPRSRVAPGVHQRGAAKLARIPVKIERPNTVLAKPAWIRARIETSPRSLEVMELLRKQKLHSVCEEAACPNLGECFAGGTATFLVMGDICTRRCPFCDVSHGRPQPLDIDEPAHLAETVQALGLEYVVITSVNRDDLRDGGAGHIAACVNAVRAAVPGIRVEVLVPDFRGRVDVALEALGAGLPDVFNHNLETVPRRYRAARPGADYRGSLALLREFKRRHPNIPTKSGLMLGLGETIDEIESVMVDLRTHGCERLTLGQYLAPSRDHLPVARYVTPDEFSRLGQLAKAMGFSGVASGPLVRSSYHAAAQSDAATPRIN